MACLICLRETLLPGADTGGTWQYIGFDHDCDGVLSGVTGTPVGALVGDNPCIDFTGFDVGCYLFRYSIFNGEECQGSEDVWVEVLTRPDAGIGVSIDLCDNGDATNLFSLLGGSPLPTGSWSGQGLMSPGYSAGDPEDPTDDMFNPVAAGIGSYTFIYTVNAESNNGVPISNCENCNGVTATITINVIDCVEECSFDPGESGSVTLCNAAGCSVDLFTILNGAPSPGGTWQFVSGPAFVPPVMPINFQGLPPGTYVFTYSVSNLDPDCTGTSNVTVNLLPVPNAGNNGVLNVCTDFGSVFLSTGLGSGFTPGGVWTGPLLPVGTTDLANGVLDPAPGDAGTYVYTYTVNNAQGSPCESQCVDTAQVTVIIHNKCNAGVDNTVQICKVGGGTPNTLVLSAAALLGGATPGTWFVMGMSPTCNNIYNGQSNFSVNGGAVINQNGQTIANGATLSQFQDVGCIRLQYTCQASNPQCTDTAFLIIQIIECAPACTSSVQIVQASCVVDFAPGNPVNCPNPIIQVQRFIGGTWQPAPGANNMLPYNGTHGTQYRVCLTNCPNCGQICSNVVTADCPPPACQITCQFLSYNPGTSQMTFSWLLTGGSGQVSWNFNHAINDNCNNCSLSTGWDVNICPGTGSASGSASCVIPQTVNCQCVRFVVRDLNNPSCITICYGVIPALPVDLNCYQSATFSSATIIDELIVNTGAGNTNILTQPQFNFTQYETEGDTPGMGGLIQLIIDINQWIMANGLQGLAAIWNTAKSNTIRFANVNFTPVSLESSVDGTIVFSGITDPCTTCDDTTSYHQQVRQLGTFCGSAGSVNLMDELLLINPDIPTNGTFYWQGGTAPPTCAGVLPAQAWTGFFSIQNGGVNHGLAAWNNIENGNVYALYIVVINNGCTECTLIELAMDELC